MVVFGMLNRSLVVVVLVLLFGDVDDVLARLLLALCPGSRISRRFRESCTNPSSFLSSAKTTLSLTIIEALYKHMRAHYINY